MDDRAQRSPGRRVLTLSVMAAFLAVLSACGTGGGDNNTNTATVAPDTVEAPTDEAVVDLTGQATTAPVSSPTDQNLASIGATEPGSASPTPAVVVSAPPIIVPTSVPTQQGTPSAPQTAASPASAVTAPTATVQAGVGAGSSIGDGTGGAPAGAPQLEVPAAGGTPGATAPRATVATSCDMPSYPAYTGDAAAQVTTSDVNFRSGPGADCEAIGEPLASGVSAQLLSDPVTREGDDQYQWVAVSIDGTDGWLATEYLEPAPE